MLENKKLGFIGGGQMCEAIFSGILKSKTVDKTQIAITDINTQRLTFLEKTYGISVILNDAHNNGGKQVAENCDCLILAVKPQFVSEAVAGLDALLRPGQLVLSIMGGIPLSFLEEKFPRNPVIRVMPNTPMLVQKGIAGVAPGQLAKEEDKQLTKEIFAVLGSVHFVPEKLIDPLTGLSGCGPAFAYMFIEALSDGGVEKGLPRDMALQLAAQTLAGAAEMVLQTGKHPGPLKDSVTSPGGGTIAGVHALESGAFRATVMNAVTQSCERMEEIAKQSGEK